jgi:hypothetical protein
MKKQLRKTLGSVLIVFAVILTVSLTVGLTAGPGWAATTGVRVSVENGSSDKGYVVEYSAPEHRYYDVKHVAPHGFAHFSSEATAWLAREKTYQYQVIIYPVKDQANRCCTATLTLRNIWNMGPKVESCEVRVEDGESGESCCTAETYTNNRCNLKVQIHP